MEKNFMTKIAVAAGLVLASLAAAGYAEDFDGRLGGAQAGLKGTVAESAGELRVPEARAVRSSGRYSPEVDCKYIRLIDKDGTSPNWWAKFYSAYEEEFSEPDAWGNYSTTWIATAHYYARAELKIGSRQLRDGESETFKLCYDFIQDKGVYEINSPFEYEVTARFLPNNESGYELTLKPLRRKPEAPSAGLLELSAFSYDDVSGVFSLKLAPKFPAYYAGSKALVAVELVQDKLFDSSLGVKFFEFPVSQYSGEYAAQFKISDFGGDKDAGDRAKAKKYFVKWGFKVKGEGFTEDYMDKGKTQSVMVLR